MKWLNLDTAILNREELIRSTPAQRGTWVALLLYCAMVENWGRIVGAGKWGNRTCEQVLRVTKRELHDPCALWTWDGDDVTVTFFPEEMLAKVEQNRERNRKQGQTGGNAKAANAQAARSQRDPYIAESKVREGKEKEGNGREENPAADDDELKFPETEEEAVRKAGHHAPDFVRKEWRRARIRGGTDWKGRPICDWQTYLAEQAEFRNSKPPGVPHPEPPPPLWERRKNAETELAKIKSELSRMPHYDKQTFPTEWAAQDKLAAPLRARREALEALLRSLNDHTIL